MAILWLRRGIDLNDIRTTYTAILWLGRRINLNDI
jgi:hypothetical protein